VVATGTYGRPLEAGAAFVERLHDAGADAVAVNAAEMAESAEGGDEWVDRVVDLVVATDDVPLWRYKFPMPYHRLLTTDALREVAATDRFIFLKDTCCDGD